VIDVRDIHYQYPGSGAGDFALRGVTFTLQAGEWVALVGANGSGKTTLLRCLNGLIQPTSGRVMVDGFSTAGGAGALFEIRKRAGMVFQNPDNQIVSTTVEREIAFGLENLGLDSAVIHRKVRGALARFRLERYRGESPNNLSGGEKQRLALASVWVMEPRFLILDEPTSLLDPSGKADFLGLIREIVRKKKMGVLLATQYPEEAAACERLLVLHRGRIRYDDAPGSVYRRKSVLKDMGLNVPVEAELGDLFA
jgi:energy-coupling factor transport system ATP-binding protein